MTELKPTLPAWFNRLKEAYNSRGKGLAILVGDTGGTFWCPTVENHLPLDQLLYHELSKFLVVKYNKSAGIRFFTDQDRDDLIDRCRKCDAATVEEIDKLGNVAKLLGETNFQALPALVLLSRITTALAKAKDSVKGRPLCIIMEYTDALLPNKPLDSLSELDRQCVVHVLSWMREPLMQPPYGNHLIVVAAENVADVNSRIVALPSAQTIEVELPDRDARERFVDVWVARRPVTFETEPRKFAADTEGLSLHSMATILEASARTGTPVGRKAVLEEINQALGASLKGAEVFRPAHGYKDVLGPQARVVRIQEIMEACENPATASPIIVLSGANGTGKSFLGDAAAGESGRIVLVLKGFRDSLFGGSERIFEQLERTLRRFSKIAVKVEEAHTEFGSVHGQNVHETERRLAGKFIGLTGDPRFFGRVVWMLFTSRPDKLDPDVLSRAAEQIPFFDLTAAERPDYIRSLAERKGVVIPNEDMEAIVEATKTYCLRDFTFLMGKALGAKKSVLETTKFWRPTQGIAKKRLLQTLVAVQNCSYPDLIPEELRNMDPEEMDRQIRELSYQFAA